MILFDLSCHAKSKRTENFISLLYYFGLLIFAGEREGRPLLKIPNRTVGQLMYGYLREAYQEIGVFRPSSLDEILSLVHPLCG